MSRSRLEPVDHFLLMIDRVARRSGLPGNLSSIAFVLEREPPPGSVEGAFARLLERLPGLRARLSLVPFLGWSAWKDEPGRDASRFVARSAGGAADAATAAEAAIGEPLDPRRDPLLGLRLSAAPQGRCLAVLRWFHPLLDARGADRLLAALDEASRGETPALEGRLLPSASTGGSSFLSSWRAFRAARALLDGEAGEAPVPLASRAEAPRRLRVAPFALGPEESAAEARASRELFGGIGANEHLLSASFRAAHRFQEERGAPKGPYALPVAVGLRAPGAAGPVLGNRLTFLHLRASAAEVSDRRALARAIRDQEVRLLRAGVDRAMGTLLRAGRWLPLRRYERERRRPDGGPRETVWFSNVGELLPGRDRWFGERIVGACVATAVPHPPGALFLFFRRAGNLAGSVVFAEGPFLREDARRLAEILREELVALP